ncbi:8-amino-7-oxononanoate synthase [Hydrogenobacter hydrogenophilus]|uniref:8-amino-7-ketopelargonate synthase n=1 Tax=Hydrogenobacter hydrogenophilus TaxID=35835 RepID=A0A285NW68_9AQUI|nr:8-amino-7-oxononanoate synthase [Hydrogenobacter hydrogenophilus]SNZ12136.1 8-amino-7-oxononanoate synthase [Hydrogenobacter hydrogenophilus]
MDWIKQELEKIKHTHLYRVRKLKEGLLDLCSNDYLALRDHPQVISAVAQVLKEYGVGSGASQLVSGYTKYHLRLEEKLAEFKKVPKCVLFGSGYLANLGVIPSLAGEGDLILSDELNHASLIDACRLSKAKVLIFKHRDYEHLENLLRVNRGNFHKCLIVSDTVFSMDGDVADIRLLKKMAKDYECMLYLDEAHATGVLGATGRGGLEEFSESWEEFMIIMGTLSKALGSYGAFVCGSEVLCEYLINKARSLIFSTSLPPCLCAGAEKSIEIIQKEPQRVRHLRNFAQLIFENLKEVGLEVSFHHTPIIPLMVYDEKRAVKLRDYLLERGILLQAIRYPTVPLGKARLRLTVSLRYSQSDLEFFFSQLREALKHC